MKKDTFTTIVVAVCLAMLVPSGAQVRASRNQTHLATVDHILIEADFIGTVDVTGQKSDESGLTEVTLQVVDTWHTRWPQQNSLHVTLDNRRGRFDSLLDDEDGPVRALVFLSGGPWRESPFTHGSNTIFRVGDRGVTCRSGNDLFAITEAGFYCSVQQYMASPPSSLSELRAQVIDLLRRSRLRHEEKFRVLSSPARGLQNRPASYIDRSLPGQEILR